MWPFKRKPDPILRNAAALDALLDDPKVLGSVETFRTMVILEGSAPEPEALADLAMAQGLDRDAAMLLCALSARLDGAA